MPVFAIGSFAGAQPQIARHDLDLFELTYQHCQHDRDTVRTLARGNDGHSPEPLRYAAVCRMQHAKKTDEVTKRFDAPTPNPEEQLTRARCTSPT
jgi:hypothetical protein